MASQFSRSAIKTLRTSLQKRGLCAGPTKNYERPAIAQISLEDPVPELPRATYVVKPKIEAKTQVTTLSNGLRVASEAKFGQFCTVGKCLDDHIYTIVSLLLLKDVKIQNTLKIVKTRRFCSAFLFFTAI